MTAFRKATMKQRNLLDNLISRHAGNLGELIRVERDILNALSVPVFFVDEGGRFLGANRAFFDFLGLDDQEGFQEGVYRRLANRFAFEYQEIDRRLIAEGGTQSFEGYACGSISGTRSKATR